MYFTKSTEINPQATLNQSTPTATRKMNVYLLSRVLEAEIVGGSISSPELSTGERGLDTDPGRRLASRTRFEDRTLLVDNFCLDRDFFFDDCNSAVGL